MINEHDQQGTVALSDEQALALADVQDTLALATRACESVSYTHLRAHETT